MASCPSGRPQAPGLRCADGPFASVQATIPGATRGRRGRGLRLLGEVNLELVHSAPQVYGPRYVVAHGLLQSIALGLGHPGLGFDRLTKIVKAASGLIGVDCLMPSLRPVRSATHAGGPRSSPESSAPRDECRSRSRGEVLERPLEDLDSLLHLEGGGHGTCPPASTTCPFQHHVRLRRWPRRTGGPVRRLAADFGLRQSLFRVDDHLIAHPWERCPQSISGTCWRRLGQQGRGCARRGSVRPTRRGRQSRRRRGEWPCRGGTVPFRRTPPRRRRTPRRGPIGRQSLACRTPHCELTERSAWNSTDDLHRWYPPSEKFRRTP